jgi:hypothetical protein
MRSSCKCGLRAERWSNWPVSCAVPIQPAGPFRCGRCRPLLPSALRLFDTDRRQRADHPYPGGRSRPRAGSDLGTHQGGSGGPRGAAGGRSDHLQAPRIGTVDLVATHLPDLFRKGQFGPLSQIRTLASPSSRLTVGRGRCERPKDQVAWPSGKGAKFSHGPCGDRYAGFNFDPQVIAVAEEMLLHRLDCLDWISRHVSSLSPSDSSGSYRLVKRRC